MAGIKEDRSAATVTDTRRLELFTEIPVTVTPICLFLRNA
jgi:hypothetical protein